MVLPPLTQTLSVSRILIVRLSAHGDVIHTLPLLTALRQQFPNATIGWLVDSSAAPLLENHPALDHLHVWPRKFKGLDILNPACWSSLLQSLLSLILDLKAQHYEVSLDAQGLFKSALWPFLAGVPHRLGFGKTRENADIFYTHRLPPRNIRDRHCFAADQCLNLARALGCKIEQPEFGNLPASPMAQAKIEQLLTDADTSKPLVALAPFTRWASKHWQMDDWSILMQGLLNLNTQLVIIGAKTDASQVEALLSKLPTGHGILNLAGQTDWTDLYALYSGTRLMIGLDSGPLHIANAVGVPDIIGIYGPTPAGRTGPIGSQHTVFETQLPCQPCFARHCSIKTHDCMKQIRPEQVLEAAARYLHIEQIEQVVPR